MRFLEAAGTAWVARADRRRDPRAAEGRHCRRGDRRRLPVGRALARPSRHRLRRLRHPVWRGGTSPADADAVRPGPRLAAPFRLARWRAPRASTDSCGRRTPASAGTTSTSWRGGFAAARSARQIESRRRSLPPPGQPLPSLELVRGASSSLDAISALADAMLRAAHGVEAPPLTDAARLDLEHARRSGSSSTSSPHGRRSPGRCAPRRRRGDRACDRQPPRSLRGRPRGRPRPAPRADPPLRGGLRARARGGQTPSAIGAGAAPRRGRAARARGATSRLASRAHRPGRARPLPVLHGVHAGPAAALPRTRGGDRRRRTARPEPVLGRRDCALSRPTTSPAGRGGARSGKPCGRSKAPDASASVRGRWQASRRSGAARPPLAIARANGWERRLERALDAFDRPTRLTHSGRARELPRSRLWRHRARALRRLLVDLAVRAASSIRERSTPGRRAPARPGRPPGALQLLLGPAEADRRRPRPTPGHARRGARVPARMPRRGACRTGAQPAST